MSQMDILTTETYVNERLKRRLEEIKASPITTIVAPLGYGKTTSILWWLKRQAAKQRDALVLYHIIAVHTEDDFWASLFRTLKKIPALSARLEALACPRDARSLSLLVEVLHNAIPEITDPLYLVIDDVHELTMKFGAQLVLMLAPLLPPNIHIVFLSRIEIFTDEERFRLGHSLSEITVRDLRLTEPEIAEYLHFANIPITKSELKDLSRVTEGWICLLYLHLKSYAENGVWLSRNPETTLLIDQLLFEPASEPTQRLLICLSLCDDFTMDQVEFLCPSEDIQHSLHKIITKNAFITKVKPDTYRLHHLLRTCCRAHFEQLPAEQQRMYYMRLGEWYLQKGLFSRAYEIFYTARDWDRFLLTLERDPFSFYSKEFSMQIFTRLKECPKEHLLAHPLSIILYMVRTFMVEDKKDFYAHKELLERALRQHPHFSESDQAAFLGRVAALESLLLFNDMRAMHAQHQLAHRMLPASEAGSMGANWCWTFSSPSVFMLYHRTPGEARDETDWIQTCVQSYQALSGGHGRGADHTFCAEYHFERAQLLDAQIQNTIAYQEARDAKQYSIMLSSRFLAMRMALFYGDWEKIEDWIETSRKLVFEHNQYLLIDTVDISAAYIFALIGRTEQIAPWLLSDAIDPSTLLRPAYPIYDVYFNQILLARGDSINVIARHASCLRQCEAFHYAEGILLLHIQHAAAQLAVNRPWRAAEALRSALSMAAPDGILMPFVESYRFIAPILDQLYEEGAYYQEIDYIRYLARKFTKSVQRILWNHWNEHERYGLSEREFQIARFAAQRKTNAEIAGELHIAEGTVRNHLSVIFDKLHITGNTKNKRHQLEDLLS